VTEPQHENLLVNLSTVVPVNELRKMRKIKDLFPYLPFEMGGLQFYVDESPGSDILTRNTGVVQTLSNKAAMGQIAQAYTPKDIVKLANQRLTEEGVDYDEELKQWEGTVEETFAKARGHTNPFHLLEQLAIMGPTGSDAKRGPTPIPWEVHDGAVRDSIKELHQAGIKDLRFNHLVASTPDGDGRGCPLSHVGNKSAAQPFNRSDAKKTQKRYWISEALSYAKKLFVKSTQSLLMFPGTVFKRYDRPTSVEFFQDTEEARSDMVLYAKDRAIIAQSFASQIAEAVVFEPAMRSTQSSRFPQFNMRTPYHTSNVLETIWRWVTAVVASLSRRFTIGIDESGWDHHMTPQGWYAGFQITRALFRPSQRVGCIHSDEFVIFNRATQRRLEEIAVGEVHPIDVRVRISRADGTTVEETRTYPASMYELETDQYMRRVLAGVSGNDISLGPIRATGYKHVLDTGPSRDGKVQVGWSMRSGNYCTFWMNSVVNLYKKNVIIRGVRNPQYRTQFKAEYGYELPTTIAIPHCVIQGDDAVLGVEVDEEFAQQIRDGHVAPSQLLADLISFSGGKANAKKQETSDQLGRFLIGFTQLFANENFPRGVSSWLRVMERMTYREDDETTGFDPRTGDNLSHLTGDMANIARMSNLAGIFGKEIHPLMSLTAGLWQDLDVPEPRRDRRGRMLPPFDKKTRDQMSLLFYTRQLRRGQAPPGSEDLFNLFNTPLGDALEERYLREKAQLNSPWSPIHRDSSGDARDKWRNVKKKPSGSNNESK